MNNRSQELITLIFNKLKNNKYVKSKITKNEVEEFINSLINDN